MKMEILWNYSFSTSIFAFTQNQKEKCSWRYNPTRLIIDEEIIPEFINCLELNNIAIPPEFETFRYENENPESITITPQKYQYDDAEIFLAKKRLLLLSEQGTGKTLVAIIAGDKIPGKKLIVAPAILIYNWEIEITRYRLDAQITVIDSPKIDIEKIDSEWIICSYARLGKINQYIKTLGIKALIVDECQALKNVNNNGKPGTKQATLAIEIAEHIEYFLALSGTPITNRLADFYNVLVCVGADDLTFKKDFKKFGQYYCHPRKVYYGYKTYAYVYDGFDHLNEFNCKLSKYMIRRNRKDLLPDLKKYRKMLPVKISGKINNMYSDIEIMGQLMRDKHEIALAKTIHTISLIKNLINEEKIVVFTSYLDALAKINSEMNNCIYITGDTPNKKRTELINQFQNDDSTRVIIVSLLCGGTGITLTAASTVVFNDIDFVPSNMLQAEDRICRIGQNELCKIYYIYALNSNLDKKLHELVNRKYSIISQAIDNENSIMFERVKNENTIEELKKYLIKKGKNNERFED